MYLPVYNKYSEEQLTKGNKRKEEMTTATCKSYFRVDQLFSLRATSFFCSLLQWNYLLSCQLHDFSKQNQLLLKWAIILGIFKLSLGICRSNSSCLFKRHFKRIRPRRTFLLSSSTVFMFSIQTASTGPSKISHFLSSVVDDACSLKELANTPSDHSWETGSKQP